MAASVTVYNHVFDQYLIDQTQPAITCSKFKTETLEQGAKYVQS